MESEGYVRLVRQRFRWQAWEQLIKERGITIDRPYGSVHPRYDEIVYPMSYGYINGTLAADGCEVDVFVGRATGGLVGLILTRDRRRADREMKLLYRCRPEDIYLAHGFINFDRRRMEGTLVMRRPMRTLWP